MYDPSSAYEDEDIKQCSEDISEATETSKTYHFLTNGDFNTIVGKPMEDKRLLGNQGMGYRNKREQWLVNYNAVQNLHIMNTNFKKN